MKLLCSTPDPITGIVPPTRDYYSFFGKTKEQFEMEKKERLQYLKKRKHDVSTALMASLGHRIERYGKKILVSAKGATTSKKR